MATKHTPGPCCVFSKGHVIQLDIGSTPTGKNPCLMHWYGFDANNLSEAQNRANAERMKLAWNCHDELVSALMDAASELNRLRYRLNNDPDRVAAVEAACRAALAKTGKES